MDQIDFVWQQLRAAHFNYSSSVHHVTDADTLSAVAASGFAGAFAGLARNRVLPGPVQRQLARSSSHRILSTLASCRNLADDIAAFLARPPHPAGLITPEGPVLHPVLARNLLVEQWARKMCDAELALSAALHNPFMTGDEDVDWFQRCTEQGSAEQRITDRLARMWGFNLLWRADLSDQEIYRCTGGGGLPDVPLLHNPHIPAALCRRMLRGRIVVPNVALSVTDPQKLVVLAEHADHHGAATLAACVLSNPVAVLDPCLRHELLELVSDECDQQLPQSRWVGIVGLLDDPDEADRLLHRHGLVSLRDTPFDVVRENVLSVPAMLRDCHPETVAELGAQWAGTLGALAETCQVVLA